MAKVREGGRARYRDLKVEVKSVNEDEGKATILAIGPTGASGQSMHVEMGAPKVVPLDELDPIEE